MSNGLAVLLQGHAKSRQEFDFFNLACV